MRLVSSLNERKSKKCLQKNEVSALNLSPTKKDFVQIWNELLDVAGKLSERWDPTSTNESDPGIVILKALTGIADKLNYNIDKNTLEAFMPTAAQEDSMRKLCDMLGYNIKYYQSATTEVTVRYYNAEPDADEKTIMEQGFLSIPRFTVITNSDNDISYFTLEKGPYISSAAPSLKIACMEGQIVQCTGINDNNIITPSQITENMRYYLPETQIAENGIFVFNVKSGTDGALYEDDQWVAVDNLNTQPRGSKVFKFGFNSYEGRPYIEFPEDYSTLFRDGIFIYYTRTSGVNGNISARTLTKLELPTTGDWGKLSSESFSVENISAATNGANIETISQAYSHFKKTIGTFDTLVTCRDYMNKIYMLTDYTNRPLVSNILVTDIRNDLNKAITICSCDDAGIIYKNTPLTKTELTTKTFSEKDVTIHGPKPVFDSGSWHLGDSSGVIFSNKTNFIKSANKADFDLNAPEDSDIGIFDANGYWAIMQNGTPFVTMLPSTINTEATIQAQVATEVPAIEQFDIVFYPFKSYRQISNNVKNIRDIYDNSFTYSTSNLAAIKQALAGEQIKTLAHKIISPTEGITGNALNIGDIVSINNYLRLNATIATNTKVTAEEGTLIIENIKIALANAFNMRELDFGEEIPFDSIVAVIENADPRIRIAALNEPALYTTFSVIEKPTAQSSNSSIKMVEYAVASDWLSATEAVTTKRLDGRFNTEEAKRIYNKLAVRNVLAGRIPLFNYNDTFVADFTESSYQITTKYTERPSDFPSIDNLPEPTADNMASVFANAGVTYTAQLIGDGDTAQVFYTKTCAPAKIKDNLLVVDKSDLGNDFLIKELETHCDIGNESGIADVKLKQGEIVKFRAPNLKVEKTYPAYVNYNISLTGGANSAAKEARAAEAVSLYSILESDRIDDTVAIENKKWQKVLNYFSALDSGNPSQNTYKKTFTLAQKISKYRTTEDTTTSLKTDKIVLNVQNEPSNTSSYSVDEFLALSGCVKLLNKNFEAKLSWTPNEGETAPNTAVPLPPIKLPFSNPFISSSEVLSKIQSEIDKTLEDEKYKDLLPTACAWTISFDFECVPFEARSLSKWEDYLKLCTEKFGDASFEAQILDFKPESPSGVIIHRLFGTGYAVGRAVTSDGTKLLRFFADSFELFTGKTLANAYLVKDYGENATPVTIKSDSEYELQEGEYLFIEYTPSNTTEDNTTQELPAVTEVYSKGTIIRPSGFDQGLVDSDYYSRSHTPHKTVTFKISESTTQDVPLFSVGVNEKIEVLKYAREVLSRKELKNDPTIYYYKKL